MSEPHLDPIEQRIAEARGFIFDMDGTIALGDSASGGHRAIEGAIELLALLRQRGVPFRVFTNGSAKSPADYAASLRAAGFDIADEEMMTPSTSAADWFVRRKIRRVRVLGTDGTMAPLRDCGLEVIGPTDKAEGVEAVFTGWYREFGFPSLEAAVRDIWAGAILTTASNVPFFAAQGGRAIGASFAINAAIRSLTGKPAKVLGKPSRAAFDCARRSMGLPKSASAQIVVVGDDPALELRMANAAGALAVGVATGLASLEHLAALDERDRPHLALPSVAGFKWGGSAKG